MDNEYKLKNSTTPSVLQWDKTFSSKILARQSTVGSCSSRFFYRAAEGVPFQWEKRPGKAITPQADDIVPPISPPPAVLAMGLPKPCINVTGGPKPRRWSSAWFVKKMKKIKVHGYNLGSLGGTRKICNTGPHPKFGSERFVYESSRFSTSSFGSTSTSSLSASFRDDKHSSNGNPRSKLALLQSRPFTCGPWRLSDIVVYFVRRSDDD